MPEIVHWSSLLVQGIFLLSGLVLAYVYAGFPLCLYLLTRKRTSGPPSELPDEKLPTVCMVVAAYNEELVIEEKIANCFGLDYPPEKLKFLFVSDSTDGTNDILRRHVADRFEARIRKERLGKFPALCEAVPSCPAEIIVLSDANTYYRPDSIRKLVRHFQDPHVGLATGDVRLLPSEEKFGKGEGFYYRYERALQILESRFWTTVGVDGGMYAVRREHFPTKAPDYGLNDDLAVGMSVALRNLRLIYDPEAIADECPTPSDGIEFIRKERIVANGIQAILKDDGVPRLGQGRLLWVFASHKVLRWLAPVFLIAGFMSSLVAIFLSGQLWAWIFGLQALFYVLALLGWKIRALSGKLFRIPYYFCMVNLAALFGIVQGIQRKGPLIWMRTDRVKTASAGSVVEP